MKSLYFVVNAETNIIEKIYAGQKYCDNYIMKKDYPIDVYKITNHSSKYNKALNLAENEIFPKELQVF